MDPGEERLGDDGVDDVAVLGEFRQPDGLADIRQADIARSQFDDLVVDPEVPGHAAGVRDVVAAGRPDRERHAVRMHLAYVQERQRAVEAAREDDADGQIGVEPNSDTVFQRGPHQAGGLGDVGDRLLAVPQGQQVDICGDGRVLDWAPPAMVARRDFADQPTDRDERLQFRRRVQVTAVARPVERLHAERVTSQVDPVGGFVDDGERELAPEAVYGPFPPLKERLQDHFGVAVTSQRVAEGGKL